MSGSQVFDTRVLLSVVSGKLFVPAWRLYDFLDFMAGCEVWPVDVSRLLPLVSDSVLSQVPVLGRFVLGEAFYASDVLFWVDQVCGEVGGSFLVVPLPSGVWVCDHRIDVVSVDLRFL